jgi:hypothetical protein
MALGRGDHPLEQAPACLLGVGALRELGLDLAQAQCERVANALELRGGEHPRPADGADAPLEAAPREDRGEELAEASLEARDLALEVLACEALGAIADRGAVEHGWHRHPNLAPLEQLRHQAPFAGRIPAGF